MGDRYVVEKMREQGFNLGGEQSGHMIMSDFATTGDGLIAALQILTIMRLGEKPISELGRVFEPLPQLFEKISAFSTGAPLEDKRVIESIKQGETRLGKQGRFAGAKNLALSRLFA